jgi:hypothetical protein
VVAGVGSGGLVGVWAAEYVVLVGLEMLVRGGRMAFASVL